LDDSERRSAMQIVVAVLWGLIVLSLLTIVALIVFT
jgi:hypothetical protein